MHIEIPPSPLRPVPGTSPVPLVAGWLFPRTPRTGRVWQSCEPPARAVKVHPDTAGSWYLTVGLLSTASPWECLWSSLWCCGFPSPFPNEPGEHSACPCCRAWHPALLPAGSRALQPSACVLGVNSGDSVARRARRGECELQTERCFVALVFRHLAFLRCPRLIGRLSRRRVCRALQTARPCPPASQRIPAAAEASLAPPCDSLLLLGPKSVLRGNVSE